MVTEMETREEPTVTALVSGIIKDAQELMSQQMRLLKSEVQEDFRRTKQAVLPLLLGVGVALIGILLLTVMFVHLLSWAFPTLPLWTCYAVVGGILAAVGGVLVLWGKQQFDAFNPLPDESAQALKENLQWLAKPK
jgi:uncharacterized membrane protein YqjE